MVKLNSKKLGKLEKGLNLDNSIALIPMTKKEKKKHSDTSMIISSSNLSTKKRYYISLNDVMSNVNPDAKKNGSSIIHTDVIVVSKKKTVEEKLKIRSKYLVFEVDQNFQFEKLDRRKFKKINSSRDGKVLYFIPLIFFRNLIAKSDIEDIYSVLDVLMDTHIFRSTGPVDSLKKIPIWSIANGIFLSERLKENRLIEVLC